MVFAFFAGKPKTWLDVYVTKAQKPAAKPSLSS
jgi:hypothetical protein